MCEAESKFNLICLIDFTKMIVAETVSSIK